MSEAKRPKSTKTKQPHKTLIELVRDCLENNGFPLEMEVADSLFSMGFNVTHSDRYVDSDSLKDREIDVVAEKTWSHQEINFDFRLKLIIECKKSEKPFVLFSGNKKRGWASFGGSYANVVYTRSEDKDTKLRFERACNGYLDPLAGSPVGYNLWRAEPKPGGSDVANEACYSVVKATEYSMSKATSSLFKVSEIITASIPIICVDAHLTKCEFDKALKIEEIDYGVLKWSQRSLEKEPARILVIKKPAFASVIGSIYKKYDDINNSIKTNNDAWSKPIEDPLDEVLKAFGIRSPKEPPKA